MILINKSQKIVKINLRYLLTSLAILKALEKKRKENKPKINNFFDILINLLNLI